MGCNCGKAKAAMKYVYTSPAGASFTYNSEIEARAAQIRNGGGTIRTVPA